MRFDAEWLLCDDGIVRPVVRAEIQSGNGHWRALELLIDTGADRTVLSANVLESLNLPADAPQERLAGVGGPIESVVLNTQIRLSRDDGRKAVFRSSYAACTDHEALDMSVLGRDLLDMFALVLDRRNDVAAIIGGRHRYSISGHAADS
jgi:predicted aspartyl protease